MSDINYQRILGAVDLAVEDSRVVDRFVQLVRDTGAKARLIHVLDPVPAEIAAAAAAGGAALPGSSQAFDEDRLEAARKRLAAVLDGYDGTEIDSEVIIGPVVDTLLDAAQAFRADVIVLGSHGRSGVRRILGSCASSVVHLAECDVLTVRLRD